MYSVSAVLSQTVNQKSLKSAISTFNRGYRHIIYSNSIKKTLLNLWTKQNICLNCQRTVNFTNQKSVYSNYARRLITTKHPSKILQIFQLIRHSSGAAASNGTAAVQIPHKAQKIVGGWLLGCAGMVFGAVVLGGVTRLTESGLSMVDWRLFKDMKPPSTQAEWIQEFEKYKQFPEYKYVTKDKEMTLNRFKFIWYMEYSHRMWGRAVGLVFAIPALIFLKKGWISRAMKPRLAIYASLIGFQGFLGWYMVKSGLVDKPEATDIPRVSQYRLASHLGSALFLYSLFLYGGLGLINRPIKMPNTPQMKRLRILTHGVMTVIFVTAFSGAFVAGLDAGLVYNSWPKMADRWIPDDIGVLDPKWKNIFENPTTVQFVHRHIAESTVAVICGFWWMCRKAPFHPRARLAVNCLVGMAFVQATLGVTTLLMYVPTHLAATHQSGSLVLLSFAVWLANELRRFPK